MPAVPLTFAFPQSVVQHNALLTASFQWSALETRLYLAMLKRIRRRDTAFRDCHIPVTELAPPGSDHVPYEELAALVTRMARQVIDYHPQELDGGQAAELDLRSLALVVDIYYVRRHGTIVARFNDSLRRYLLNLTRNFTLAELGQLHQLKSSNAHRLYWLLKQHRTFGFRYFTLPELRHILGLTTQYAGRFDHFRARVLEPARRELAATDLPFTYELVKQGRRVTGIYFTFPRGGPPPASPPPAEAWARELLAAGVRAVHLAAIRQQLAAGVYDERHLYSMLNTTRQRWEGGEIKRLGGAIVKALRTSYPPGAGLTGTRKPAPGSEAATATPGPQP